MNAKTRRTIASRLLLAVFVPMVVFVSLHVHQSEDVKETTCYECDHHLPHPGHISAATATLHDCLLCQLTHVTFDIPQTTYIHYYKNLQSALYITFAQATVAGVQGLVMPRAPPA